MKLTPDELVQVSIYLDKLPKYRETVQELKDHVLSALDGETNVRFDIKLVEEIILDDLGGGDCIIQQEVSYKDDLTSRYFKLLAVEVLNMLKWPGILQVLPTLALCAILYYAHQQTTDYDSSPMVKTIYIIIYFPGLLFLYRKFVANRFKKASILDDFLHKVWMFSALSGTLVLKGISYTHRYFEYADKMELLLFLFMFIVTSVFLRAYIKLYKNKIQVLAA
jgi:hypothetical protein